MKLLDDIVDGYLTRAWYAENRHGVIFPYEDYRIYNSRGSDLDLGDTNPIYEADVIGKLHELGTFNLKDSELDLLTKNVRVHRYGKGEVVLEAGVESRGLYVVLEGQVKKSMLDAQGQNRDLGYANSGDLLGLVSVIHREDNIANARAESDCQIAVLDRDSVYAVLKGNPKFSHKIELGIEVRLKTVNAIRAQQQINLDNQHNEQNRDVTLKDLLRKQPQQGARKKLITR